VTAIAISQRPGNPALSLFKLTAIERANDAGKSAESHSWQTNLGEQAKSRELIASEAPRPGHSAQVDTVGGPY
jgi:hypothetical protein